MNVGAALLLTAGATPPPLPDEFIGVSTKNTGVAHTLPAGWEVGDIGIVIGVAPNGVTGTISAGWSQVGSTYDWPQASLTSYDSYVFARVLEAGDSGPTFTAAFGGSQLLVVRAGSVVSLKSWAASPSNTDTTIEFAGFSKAGGSDLVIIMTIDRDPSTSGEAPEPFQKVGAGLSDFFGYLSFLAVSADYVETDTELTGFDGAAYGQIGAILEIT